jgi:hypothetical protein
VRLICGGRNCQRGSSGSGQSNIRKSVSRSFETIMLKTMAQIAIHLQAVARWILFRQARFPVARGNFDQSRHPGSYSGCS